MTITKHGRRLWRVLDDDGSLVCLTAYRKGAREVVRRLTAARSLSLVSDPLALDEMKTAKAVKTLQKGGG